MNVSEIMTSDPVTVPPECDLHRAVMLMDEQQMRHLPVVEKKQLVGVLSERDVLEATGWEPHRYFDQATKSMKTARDFMGVQVDTVPPDEEITRAAELLSKHRIGCLPVVQDGRVVGTLTETDLMQAFVLRCGDSTDDSDLDPPLWERMSRDVVATAPETQLAEALGTLRSERLRHLPVIHDGWFVGMLSDRDLRLRAGRGELESRRVDEIMSTELITLGPGNRLSEAAGRMLKHRFSSICVLEEGRLIGLVTSTDVLEHCQSIDWGQ